MTHYLRASFLALMVCALTSTIALIGMALQTPAIVSWKTGKVNVEVVLPLANANYAGQLSALKVNLVDHLTAADGFDADSELTLFVSPLFSQGRLANIRATLGSLHTPIAEAEFDSGSKNLTDLIIGFLGKAVPGPIELRLGKHDFIATPTIWQPRADTQYKNQSSTTFTLQPYRHLMIVDGALQPCGKQNRCLIYPAEPMEWERPAPFRLLAGFMADAFTQSRPHSHKTSSLKMTDQLLTVSARYAIGPPILQELR